MIEKKVKGPRKNYNLLLNLARSILNNSFKDTDLEKYAIFSTKSAVCIILKQKNKLIAYDGLLDDKISLAEKILYATRVAGFEISHLSDDERAKLDIEILLLSHPKIMKVKHSDEYLNKIVLGKDGIMIAREYITVALMPIYAEHHKLTVKQFFEKLCEKAELQKNDWKNLTNKFLMFTVKKVIK